MPPSLLISAQRTVCGSDIASPQVIVSMLEFAAKHRITPIIETAPMVQVNESIAKLKEILGGQYVSQTGMGLGLSGAKRLSHEFDIASRPGDGTRITIRRWK